MLKGQAITAYNDYMKKSMSFQPKEPKEKSSGLLSRNKTVDPEDTSSDDYIIEQFNTLKKLRVNINNG
jgi:hypothetical protein|tara:strand:+ start:303 stop:506 length:204 start_codon:yes stop_codon:yes gene_type:complete